MTYDELLRRLEALIADADAERHHDAAAYLRSVLTDLRDRRRYFDTRPPIILLPPER